MNRFCSKMSEYLGHEPNVQVFSIQPGEANLQASTLKVIDVRFTARGLSSYVTSSVLDGLIMQHRSELEDIIGAKIVSGGNDMCKFTKCDYGCHTVHNADESGYLVSANQTVILGINAWSNDSCKCPIFEPPPSCRAGICRNGGVCHNTYPTGFFCECRDNSLKGFRCQGTTRSFNGAGYAWFKPIPACTSLNITLQFMTSELNGLLLYNGPFGNNISASHLDYFDYLAIRLNGGKIEAEYAFNGINKNILQVPSTSELNDGKWHSVSFTQIGKKVELVLDNYGLDDVYPAPVNSSFRVFATTVDDDERLNMNTPLQYFNGCIRDLIVNGEKYDLGVPDLTDEENTSPGCSMNAAVCGIDNSYCRHGECVADASSSLPKCICDPGYSGVQCDLEVEWVEFGPGAFIEYDVAVFLQKIRSDIDVLVYPGQRGTGTLGYGKDTNKYVGTYLNNYSPGGVFDCGENSLNSSLNLQMDQLKMNNNYSYWVQFTRNPARATLTVDGTYYLSEQLDPVKRPFEIQIKELLLGARSSNGATDFQGCIGTFRWEHQNLPLLQNASLPQDTTQNSDIIYVQRSEGIVCSPPFICVDFWKGPFCTCPVNLMPVLGQDGTVLRCGEVVAYSKLGISNNAIIIIMVFLGLLLLMALLMIVYSRRQTPPFAPVRPVELNRDNIRPYDIEGGGEADNDQYDINGLRKPVMPLENGGLGGYPAKVCPTQRAAPDDNISAQIKNLEADPDATAPYDELHIYGDEGDDRSIVSLESLESAGYPAGKIDELNIGEWGEPFKELAKIYGKKE
uniref:Neurexin-4 n=1 Tax=Syphacia muris TaxID=451379 RepID=A0A0N5B1F4_9BILA